MVFTAALPMGNFGALDAKLTSIADPSSPIYGQWMSQEEVLGYMAPPAEVRAGVRGWLEAQGASCVDWPSSLRCSAAVADVEAAFSTTVSQYTQVPTGKTLYRVHPSVAFTLPAALEGRQLFVTSITDFPSQRMRMGSGILALDGGKAVPFDGASLRGAVKVASPDVDLVVTLETVQRMCEYRPP